ncbi:hypothetical protein D3C72_2090980 [compost metagenome]
MVRCSPANQRCVTRCVSMNSSAVFTFGSITFSCTLSHSALAIGFTKNGMGWVGMVMNTSFITSQFMSEPSA